MRQDLQQFIATGGVVYAECGGLMYLSRALWTARGERVPMVDVLPVETRMLARRKALGYVEVTTRRATLWGPAGTVLRGHEFHYSELIEDPLQGRDWHAAYDVLDCRQKQHRLEGYARGAVLVSYLHLHWASRPDLVAHFIEACARL
jgi:cobyrinic acid a,c-diamide synthase